MTKWLSRLLGLLVLLLIILFTFNKWFKPNTPDALRREIDLQVRGQTVPPPATPSPLPETQTESTQLTPPALTLTSLEDFPADGGAAPILANPQPEQNRTETVAPATAPKTTPPQPEVIRTESPAPESGQMGQIQARRYQRIHCRQQSEKSRYADEAGRLQITAVYA